jgi:hypothetical protein
MRPVRGSSRPVSFHTHLCSISFNQDKMCEEPGAPRMLGYEELTEPERAVWNATETGVLVELPIGAPAVDDPATGETWGEDRQIRAQLLYELLIGITGPTDVRPRAVKLAGARITGTLDLEAATLKCPLHLRGCSFERPINLQEAQAPALRLPRCDVPGLFAQQLQIRGGMFCRNGFSAEGEVNLVGAHIGGNLEFDRATLTNPTGRALDADSLTVDRGMFCRNGFSAEGEVNLVGAHIGGNLEFDRATLTNRTGPALNAASLTVDLSVFCRNGFSAEGEVNLVGAHIGSNLEFDRATLTNPTGRALDAASLTVDRGMFCRNGFSAEGEVNLVGAHIGGTLDFQGATLANPEGMALALGGLRTSTLVLRPRARPGGTVDLTNAQVDVCYDSRAAWSDDLRLDGFTYGALVARPAVDVTMRLRWLERDPGSYTPQLYEQLAAVYRKAGHDDDARKVAIAKQRRRRQTLNSPGKLWNSLLRWTVGYGYQTWKAGVWLLVLVGLGWWSFDRAHNPYPAHLLAAKPPGQRPWFHAGLYALDLLLPFADLGYQSAWITSGWARWLFLAWNLAGWVLITAVLAALSGLIKRD